MRETTSKKSPSYLTKMLINNQIKNSFHKPDSSINEKDWPKIKKNYEIKIRKINCYIYEEKERKNFRSLNTCLYFRTTLIKAMS